jgi:CrcB protein
MIAILISLFGGIGASTRFIADGLLRSVFGRRFPWATMIINVIGSFILGVVVGIAIAHPETRNLELIIGTGFCGGFTTFSTAIFESIRLLQEKRYFSFWLQFLGNFLLCLAAAGIGVWLGAYR